MPEQLIRNTNQKLTKVASWSQSLCHSTRAGAWSVSRVFWISSKCFNLTPPKFSKFLKFSEKCRHGIRSFWKDLFLDRVLSHAFKLFVLNSWNFHNYGRKWNTCLESRIRLSSFEYQTWRECFLLCEGSTTVVHTVVWRHSVIWWSGGKHGAVIGFK